MHAFSARRACPGAGGATVNRMGGSTDRRLHRLAPGRLRCLVALAVLAAPGPAGAAAGRAGAHGPAGVWVSTGSRAKIVLRLEGSTSPFRGTYAQGATTVKVLARSSSADGSGQLTLTFTASGRSAMCGLHAGRLYCQLGPSGTTVFVPA
jgi:hypothetical protein